MVLSEQQQDVHPVLCCTRIVPEGDGVECNE